MITTLPTGATLLNTVYPARTRYVLWIIVEATSHNPLITVNASPAAVYRSITADPSVQRCTPHSRLVP